MNSEEDIEWYSYDECGLLTEEQLNSILDLALQPDPEPITITTTPREESYQDLTNSDEGAIVNTLDGWVVVEDIAENTIDLFQAAKQRIHNKKKKSGEQCEFVFEDF